MEDVLAILALADVSGATSILDGGWSVDALLGEQTREHRWHSIADTIAIRPIYAMYACYASGSGSRCRKSTGIKPTERGCAVSVEQDACHEKMLPE